MLGFFRKDKKNKADDAAHEPELSKTDLAEESTNNSTAKDHDTKPEKKGLFQKIRQGLTKTRKQFTSGIANAILGKKTIDDELLEEIETQLITADLGIETTQYIINELTQRVSRKELKDPAKLFDALREILTDILTPTEHALALAENEPTVILMVGINGAGKTTTIGKLAKYFQNQGKKVMLAAGDTFRAAAVEQLQVWGERNDIAVIAQPGGKDSASVMYDAMQAANAREMDILLADTAGRLHTQANLMEELKKVKRVIQKHNPNAPHECMLVLDASIGQNALRQAAEFHEAIGVSSVAITKLDGTAKGGIIFAIAKQLQLPIRFIGVGEGIDDLKRFEAKLFVEALLSDGDHTE